MNQVLIVLMLRWIQSFVNRMTERVSSLGLVGSGGVDMTQKWIYDRGRSCNEDDENFVSFRQTVERMDVARLASHRKLEYLLPN